MIVGIDPGKSGAVVALSYQGCGIFESNMVWRGEQLRGKEENELNDRLAYLAMLEAFSSFDGIHLVVLEKQWAGWKGNGISSQANIVGEFRAWRAICACLDVELMCVAPRKWQKVIPDKKKGKESTIRFVENLVPDLDLRTNPRTGRVNKPHDGIADAAAMAIFGTKQKLIEAGTPYL